ncbi:uncharacterized protein LOC141620305 [Silene latifolia]|uniref:uncharacterized protein LOC141620305 n=1 Tax=Silene latifolia TaxID=37657 RepID=UPI003D770675
MVFDALEFTTFNSNDNHEPIIEQEPHPQAKSFFEMLKALEKPLYKGSRMSLLQAASRLVTLKCEFNMPFNVVDGIASLLEDVIPDDNVMTRSFYNTKKVVKGLQLPHQKIDACLEGCMLFWKDDALLDKCRKCQRGRYETSEGDIVLKGKGKKGNKRGQKSNKPLSPNQLIYFPLAPRLQRMYATKNIAEKMRWHKEHPRTPGKMCHPSDGEEWQRFDKIYPDFAEEPRPKACLCCMDKSKASDRHLHRSNKKAFIKVKEVLDDAPDRLPSDELWELIRDLPSTVDGTEEEFKLLKKKKSGWFKRSIFWDLPYGYILLIRHNLDVMHIEKNFFEQLIHMIMDVEGKSKDTIASRKELKCFYDRSKVHIRKDGSKPKAMFALDKFQRKALCQWLGTLKFPDRYASDFKRCVDLKNSKLQGLKSHDCHVFLERLLPVAFKHLLPTTMWNAVTEISQFFRDLCSSSISVDDMIRLEDQIPEILYFIKEHPNVSRNDVWNKYEDQFPPCFRNHVIECNTQDDLVRSLAFGPSRKVKTWNRYSVNGFNFHTFNYGKRKQKFHWPKDQECAVWERYNDIGKKRLRDNMYKIAKRKKAPQFMQGFHYRNLARAKWSFSGKIIV